MLIRVWCPIAAWEAWRRWRRGAVRSPAKYDIRLVPPIQGLRPYLENIPLAKAHFSCHGAKVGPPLRSHTASAGGISKGIIQGHREAYPEAYRGAEQDERTSKRARSIEAEKHIQPALFAHEERQRSISLSVDQSAISKHFHSILPVPIHLTLTSCFRSILSRPIQCSQ